MYCIFHAPSLSDLMLQGVSELPFMYQVELFLLLLLPLAETITACILFAIGGGFMLRTIQKLIPKTYSCSSHPKEEEPKSETGNDKSQKQTDWGKSNPMLIFCVSDLRSFIRSAESLQSQEESLTAV